MDPPPVAARHGIDSSPSLSTSVVEPPVAAISSWWPVLISVGQGAIRPPVFAACRGLPPQPSRRARLQLIVAVRSPSLCVQPGTLQPPIAACRGLLCRGSSAAAALCCDRPLIRHHRGHVLVAHRNPASTVVAATSSSPVILRPAAGRPLIASALLVLLLYIQISIIYVVGLSSAHFIRSFRLQLAGSSSVATYSHFCSAQEVLDLVP